MSGEERISNKNIDPGERNFKNHPYRLNPAPFIKVSDKISSAEVIEYMINEWGLKKIPDLIISVTGGAKKFNLDNKMKRAFKNGLVKVAKSTGAWIITGGTNYGVMRLVGEAIAEGIHTNELVVIGIATFGVIDMTEETPNPRDSVVSSIKRKEDAKKTFLDPNHSHFILVDAGRGSEFGQEIAFRSRLESDLIKYVPNNDSANVNKTNRKGKRSSVLIVVEGGIGTLNTVEEALKAKMPVLLIQDSKGCADLIINVCAENDNDVQQLAERSDFKNSEDFKNEDKKKKIIDTLTRIRDSKYSKFINIYKLGSGVDIEFAILTAILRSEDVEITKKYIASMMEKMKKKEKNIKIDEISNAEITEDNRKDLEEIKEMKKEIEEMYKDIKPENIKTKIFENLKLALQWNYDTIAKNEILSDEFVLENTDKFNEYNELFKRALIYNRPKFFEMLLESGGSIEKFILQESQSLYNYELELVATIYENERKLPIWTLLEKVKNTTKTESNNEIVNKLIKLLVSSNIKMTLIEQKDNKKYALQELFIWSLLFNRIEIAKMLWKRQPEYQIINALFASTLLKTIGVCFDDFKGEMTAYSNEFENAAIEIFNLIDKNTNNIVTCCLLLRQVDYFNVDCLQMAIYCDCKNFIAQPSVQYVFNEIWLGQLNVDILQQKLNSKWFRLKYFACLFTGGLLGPVLFDRNKILDSHKRRLREDEIRYTRNSSFKGLSRDVFEDYKSIWMKIEKNNYGSKNDLESQRNVNNTSLKLLNYFQQLWGFLRTPSVNYVYDSIFYALFLFLFSYLMLTEFAYYDRSTNMPKIQPIHIVLYIWVICMFFEELRQFVVCGYIHQTQGLPKSRQEILTFMSTCSRRYFKDSWNILDVLGILLFVIGMITKNSSQSNNETGFIVSRIILSVDLIIWFLKALYYGTNFRLLGPKLRTLKKMIFKDLSFFIIIIGIISCVFGIVSQALMFPINNFDSTLITALVDNAYWPIFGDVPIRDKIFPDDATCSSDNNDTSCIPEINGARFTYILLMVYVLAILVLVNLLIAMFNSTFESIESDSDKLWQYDRYFMIFSYYHFPFLPPPLNFVSYIVIFIVDMKKKYDRKKDNEKKDEAKKDGKTTYFYEHHYTAEYLDELNNQISKEIVK